jgi:hypothetical protein
MVLTVSFVLSPVTGLVCHRYLRNTFRKLDTSVGASGPHDFAVRFSLARQARIRVHRIPPRACDVASRPSEWDETESRYSCFYRAVKRKFRKIRNKYCGRVVTSQPYAAAEKSPLTACCQT